ncbi:mitochondrial 37S ribosomal protein uS17m KNAG_0F01660 [Huiozyma naganishii CBS 8797]|uniref:37S ribosomal protein S17, mitochondrial n=1 Tax=Huiozyma naganishii (strain ATCC MYA-139 / BCRC 22969 / CBS 8797 / KCTC 17520 / NBRC 10181 / NCYC 3082 / Yp74L-3) TaxID=1071383 RepID=J7S787_HUIN7|nr:hypothetical protein KNAG_0F01660 [Kazachstania naganishii CBS 8797]CCK70834.1 hypothetical protein KNAG_0F01660 [Kazachstania naganishii CBS 8797]
MARQNFIGMVVSQGKMQKTVKVRIERKVFDKRINKELFRRKDFLVHDEEEISREGDMVRIEATRPLSKRKFFSIAEIIKNKGQQFAQFESKAKIDVAREEAVKSQEFLDRRLQRQESDTDGVLLRDIRTIQLALTNSDQSPEELAKIKQKYGIQEFSPATVKQLLQLDISSMEEQLETKRNKLDNMQRRLQELITDEDASTKFLNDHGIADPSVLQKNIRKNIIRKHLLKEL